MQRELGYGGKYLCYVFGLTILYGRVWFAKFIIKKNNKTSCYIKGIINERFLKYKELNMDDVRKLFRIYIGYYIGR